MKTYQLVQGSEAWHAHRNSGLFFNASDAAAMLGIKGAHSTRDQLLRVYKYRIESEVSEYLQRKFDDGHRFEALARPLAEAIMGEDLYPVIGTEGSLSASFDGITASFGRCWEHKSANKEIREAFAACDGSEFIGLPCVELPAKYYPQMQQQMSVAGAALALFSATRWNDDGECLEQLHCWQETNEALAARIVTGWRQFRLDLDAMPELEVIKETQMAVIGRAPDALPVLRIRLAGLVTLTENNVSEYRETVRAMLAENNTKPVTDQDFADADKRVKFAGKAEDDLLNAENSLLSETGSVASVISDLRAMRSEFREFRLAQEKYLSTRKDAVRSEIVSAGIRAFAEFRLDLLDSHVADWPIKSGFSAPEIATNFPGCIKNLRTIESMQNAVNTELARAKIAARELFDTVRSNIATAIELARHELWPDLSTGKLVFKPVDDFRAILTGRIDKADKAEAERIAQAVKDEADRIAKGVQDAQDAADKIAANKAYALAQAHETQQRADEAARLEKERADAYEALQAADDAAADDAEVIDAEWVEPAPPSAITITAPPVLATPANTINIGEISARLGPTVTRAFLEQLGFHGVRVGSFHKYLDTDFPKIVQALIAHLQKVKSQAIQADYLAAQLGECK